MRLLNEGWWEKESGYFKMWYTPLIATDLEKYFLSQRLKPMVGVGMLSSF